MKQSVQALILLLAGFAATGSLAQLAAPTCPSGTNLVQGQCTHTKFACGARTTKTDKGCVGEVVPPACPQGYTLAADGRCSASAPPVVACPQGMTLSADRKSCTTTTSAPPVVTCPQGLKLSTDGSSCSAVAGAACPNGSQFIGEGRCLYDQTPNCGPYKFVNGACVGQPGLKSFI